MTEYNKVVYDGQTLIDLTQDDVTSSDVRSGVYFHNSAGVRGQGTLASTSTPTANTIAEWDSDTHMNSEDMTSAEVSDFVDDLNVSPINLIDVFYPVGSYYETSDTTFNPNITWGGTWVLETEGQVHVSAGLNYEVGDTGGSKDAVIVSHTHLLSSGWQSASGQPDRITYGGVNGSYQNTGYGNVQFVQSTGESGTDKNMPPYIVVNRWHRTA